MQRVKNEEEKEELINEATFSFIRGGTVLQEKGKPIESFFIILEGNGAIHGENGGDSRTVSQGDCFGENGMVFELNSKELFEAQGDLLVLEIKRKSFLKNITALFLSNLEKVAKFLRQLDQLSHLKDDSLIRLAECSQIVVRTTGAVIAVEGSNSEFVYFVKYGQVKVLKKKEEKQNRKASIFEENEQAFGTRSSGGDRRNTSWKSIEDFWKINDIQEPIENSFEVGEMGKGGMLCEEAYIGRSKIPYTAVTTFPTELVRIPVEDLKRTLTLEEEVIFMGFFKKLQRETKIIQIQNEGKKWRDFKSSLSSSVLAQKQNKISYILFKLHFN